MAAMIYPIPAGLYCVPSALCALTGDDPESVIIPAINRHAGAISLLDAPSGVAMWVACAVLKERGYRVRNYLGNAAAGPLRVKVKNWAERTFRWPDRSVLITTGGPAAHAMVVFNGKIYDNHAPFGATPEEHPFRHRCVIDAVLVEQCSPASR